MTTMSRYRVAETSNGPHAVLSGAGGARHAVQLLSGRLRPGDELEGGAPRAGFQLLSAPDGRFVRVIFESHDEHRAAQPAQAPATA